MSVFPCRLTPYNIMVTMKMMMIMIMMMTMIIRKGLYVHPATAVRAEEEFRKEKKNVCETQ